MLDPNAAPAPAAAPEKVSPQKPPWTDLIPEEEWQVYQAALRSLGAAGVPFLLGGAFGLAAYTGRWRNTKDLDLYILPEDRDKAVALLSEAGFTDYYQTRAYDRGWIYRATRAGVIVDLIWGTPNRRTLVDVQWLTHASRLLLRTEEIGVVPAEELLWIKLYVLQRDRCDWPDLVNLLYARSAVLDWERLTVRLADDLPLLIGFLVVFAWLCPDRVPDIPAQLRKQAGLTCQTAAHAPETERINLLDSRPWFAAHQPSDRPMQL